MKSKPDRTLFVSRFGPKISKSDLKEVCRIFTVCKIKIFLQTLKNYFFYKFFSEYGEVVSAKVIYDVVTGHSQCYGFVEMKHHTDAWRLARRNPDLSIMNHKIFVDFENSRTMKGWKPRRLGKCIICWRFFLAMKTLTWIIIFTILGGGLGGKKESGQLRFGGKERPFKKPYLFDVSRSWDDLIVFYLLRHSEFLIIRLRLRSKNQNFMSIMGICCLYSILLV